MRPLDGRGSAVTAHERGFDIHPGVLTGREIESLVRSMDGLGRSRAGVRHLMSHQPVTVIAGDPRLLSLATAMLGSQAVPYRATLFDKSPGANWLVVWHQDTALPLQQRREVAGWGPWSTKAGLTYAHAPRSALEQIVALRVHLDDSTAKNGPLRVISGSHRLGVLSDAAIQEIVARHRPHECTVERGGVLAMRPLLVHSSSKSTIPLPRRVLHLEYASTMDFGPNLELRVA
jgi:ectoine hydroxylase-related dioxygenase (phytanoyl-CoA dioxygenase family)